MKRYLLHIVLFFCLSQYSSSQEDGIVALAIPVRNSLKFNKYTINPTFSFVREQNKYISFSNKREWVQFDNAPQTFLFGYSGRFGENAGLGIGVFQQNYGVLTTFGGVLNYAYNAVFDKDSNLTFGMNVGFYKSGVNEGNVITNFPDPSLENVPSNTLITINPGINYGTAFFDFGVSINNLVSYNLKTSEILEDNPKQSVQGHIMYTGYVNSRGFFDESKFSGIIRSEFKKDNTVISGIAMLTVPKGIWAQAGYNSLYGMSAGLGVNITAQIALEYNYEKAIGDMATFGNSHEFTLAYRFKNKYRYSYSGDDDEQAILISSKKTKRVLAKSRPSKPKVDRAAIAEAKAKAKEETQQKRLAEEAKIKADKEAKVKLDAERKAIADVEAQARTEDEARLKLEQETKAKVDEAARVKLAEEVRVKRLAEEAKVEAEAIEQAKLAAEAKEIADAQVQAKIEEAARVKLAKEAQDKADEEARIKQEELEGVVVQVPTDDTTREINGLTKLTQESKIAQQELLLRLTETVTSKEQDLKDLKEENDLSEQGIYVEPKPFKSISAENAAIDQIKTDLDNLIKEQTIKIQQLETVYLGRLKKVGDKLDPLNVQYSTTIQELKTEQLKTIKAKENLAANLDKIKVATEIERKRRIKRALYDNEEDRYKKDRAALNQIVKFTPESTVPLKEEDFDFGEEPNNNIQILKDVKNAESGYYLVIAVHEDVVKRDEFLTKTVSAGQTNINFFYDVNTSKYFIYYEKFDNIETANRELKSKGNEPYNSKMSMVKIEN